MTGFSKNVRDIIINRAEGRCERCGLRKGIHFHHRRPRGMGGTKQPSTNQPSAGLWLCLKCHSEIESFRYRSRCEGLLVSQHKEPVNVPVLYRGKWVLLDDFGTMREAA